MMIRRVMAWCRLVVLRRAIFIYSEYYLLVVDAVCCVIV